MSRVRRFRHARCDHHSVSHLVGPRRGARVDQSAFGFDDRDLDPDAATSWIEWDRAFGVQRGGTRLPRIYVVFSYGLSVPARQPEITAVVPMAGLSWVSVHPDHRRQGLLSAMMGTTSSVHEAGRGEALSCLFASESAIYGRFGYGPSTQSSRLTLPAQGGAARTAR